MFRTTHIVAPMAVLFSLGICSSNSRAADIIRPNDHQLESNIRQHYGQDAEQPLPESVAFYSIVDLIQALSASRYDVTRILVEQHLDTDSNETTNFIDSIVQLSLDISRAVNAERQEKLCLPVSTSSERDVLYKAMDNFDDWKEELYGEFYREFFVILSEYKRTKLTAWVAKKSTTTTYIKTNHKSGWESNAGSEGLARWVKRQCSSQKERS